VPRDLCTVTEILEFCQARMASFKVPSVVEFRDRLPKSSAGKILRRSL
jgi:long-chain acyl-CoA synthetase